MEFFIHLCVKEKKKNENWNCGNVDKQPWIMVDRTDQRQKLLRDKNIFRTQKLMCSTSAGISIMWNKCYSNIKNSVEYRLSLWDRQAAKTNTKSQSICSAAVYILLAILLCNSRLSLAQESGKCFPFLFNPCPLQTGYRH